MRNFLLKKSARDELEQRGMTYREYIAERNALRSQGKDEKVAECTNPADTQLQQEPAEYRDHASEPGRVAAETAVSPDTGLATWLQVPTINFGAQVDVVGEQHYQEALEALAVGRNAFGTRRRLLTVALVREPGNEYDVDAVRVEAAGATVGHLSRDDAPRFHAIIERLTRAGVPATCRAMLTGGWDRGSTDRGMIGIKVFTGRRPARWNGRAAFLRGSRHEDHIVKLHRSVISLDELGRKPIVALADTQAGAVEVSVDDRALGHISSRLDLGVYINRVRQQNHRAPPRRTLLMVKLAIAITDPASVTAALARTMAATYARTSETLPTGWWICQRCHRIGATLATPAELV